MVVKSELRKRFDIAVHGVLFLIALVPLFVLAPYAEARLNPVVIPTNETFTRDEFSVFVESKFDKPRGHCVVDQAQFDYLPDQGPSLSVVRAARLNRSTGGPGKLVTPYHLTAEATFPGTLRRVFWYRCHGLYLTPFYLPPLRIE